MPAYTRRWTKVRNTPTVTTFECRAYDAEVVSPNLDTSDIQQQMRQLRISLPYPARTPAGIIPGLPHG